MRRVLTHAAAALDVATKTWMGPDRRAAELALVFAREERLRGFGPLIYANLASHVDAWAFAKTIAKHVGCSRRTFQRWASRLKERGMLFTRRSREGEIPPRASSAFPCGYAHKWIVGRELPPERRRAAVLAARSLKLERALRRDELTHSMARKLGLPREIRRLGTAATIAVAAAAAVAATKPVQKPKPVARDERGLSTLDRLNAELERRPRAAIEIPIEAKPRDGPT